MSSNRPTKRGPLTRSEAVAKPYEPTPEDRALVEVHAARKRANPPAPRIKVRASNNSVHEISADYPDDTVGWLRIMDALGVKDFDAASGLVHQIANAGTQGRGPDETGVNSMLSFVKGIEPRDQVEAMAYAPAMLSAAKIGILGGSAVSAAAGFLMLMWLTSRKEAA